MRAAVRFLAFLSIIGGISISPLFSSTMHVTRAPEEHLIPRERIASSVPVALIEEIAENPKVSKPAGPPTPPVILPVTSEGYISSGKSARATLFWVGESADASNLHISNHQSYWDGRWQEHFGGVDDPTSRCGYHPCVFTPKENPFYIALPYGEYTSQGALKDSVREIPWYGADTLSLLKNRWVEITYGSRVCYGQWEDVGPAKLDDFAYVFGDATTPQNTFGERAGIDLSPALFTCLGLTTNADVTWRFVKETQVPIGPWKDIVTTFRGTR